MGEVSIGDRSVIVAAGIMRDRAVLLARRTRPESTAGRWEMPGGRVEPGESDVQALQREIIEELGIEIDVGERIGEHPLAGIGLLRVYLARPRVAPEGRARPEPRLLDHHDQLRWVRPSTVTGLPLAPGDATLLPLVFAHLT